MYSASKQHIKKTVEILICKVELLLNKNNVYVKVQEVQDWSPSKDLVPRVLQNTVTIVIKRSDQMTCRFDASPIIWHILNYSTLVSSSFFKLTGMLNIYSIKFKNDPFWHGKTEKYLESYWLHWFWLFWEFIIKVFPYVKYN